MVANTRILECAYKCESCVRKSLFTWALSRSKKLTWAIVTNLLLVHLCSHLLWVCLFFCQLGLGTIHTPYAPFTFHLSSVQLLLLAYIRILKVLITMKLKSHSRFLIIACLFSAVYGQVDSSRLTVEDEKYDVSWNEWMNRIVTSCNHLAVFCISYLINGFWHLTLFHFRI